MLKLNTPMKEKNVRFSLKINKLKIFELAKSVKPTEELSILSLIFKTEIGPKKDFWKFDFLGF